MKNTIPESDYYHQYKLARDPFPLNTIDNVLFLTHEHNQVLDLLKQQITNSQKLITVIAPTGGGKTFLSNHVDVIREPDWKVNLVRAHAGMGIDELAGAFVQQIFREESGESAKAVSKLHKYLEWSARKKTISVLIIDDADKLPVETLEFVLQLAELRYGESLFRIVLLATENINSLLDDLKLKDLAADLVHKISIPALSKEQTRAYIEKRLSLCGAEDKAVFTEQEISHIFENSGGLPKDINLHARKIMRDSAKSKTSGEKSGLASVVFGIIAILTVATFYLMFNQQQTADIAVTTAIPSEQATTPAQPGPVTAEVQTIVEEPPSVPALSVAPEHPPDRMEQETESEADRDDQTGGDEQPSLELPATASEEAITEIESVIRPIESETETGVTGRIEGAQAPIDVAVDEVEPDGDVTISGVIVSEVEPEVPEVVDEVPVPVPVEVPAAEERATEPPLTEQQAMETGCHEENIYHLGQIPDFIACVKGSDWFRQQPPMSYTLQLISSQDVDSVGKLLHGTALDKDQLSGYTNYTSSGNPRYLLFYGIYPDNVTAKEAVQSLPSEIMAVKPWPRKISDIVKALDALETGGY